MVSEGALRLLNYSLGFGLGSTFDIFYDVCLLCFIISLADYVKASHDFCCNTNVDTSCIRFWSMQQICCSQLKD